MKTLSLKYSDKPPTSALFTTVVNSNLVILLVVVVSNSKCGYAHGEWGKRYLLVTKVCKNVLGFVV